MRKYLFRNVITSVPVVLTMNAADSVLMLGSSARPGLPAVVPEWVLNSSKRLRPCPPGFGGRRLSRAGDVHPGVALSFIGEGLDAWVSGDETRP